MARDGGAEDTMAEAAYVVFCQETTLRKYFVLDVCDGGSRLFSATAHNRGQRAELKA